MKTRARSSPSNIGFVAIFAAVLMLGAAQNAMAAGTTAGTSITNSVTLSYDVLGVAQTDKASNTASFLVDEKINLTVTGGATTNVVPGATAQVSTFSVTNNANSPLDFTLAVNQVAAGDQFDATACNAFVESGATAGYQAAQDTATFIDELAADASKDVYVVCSIPASQVNTDIALVGLTATARGDFTGTNGVYAATVGTVGAAISQTAGADTAAVDIVFADVAGTESGDVARDAKHSARNTYAVVTAALAISKTATLLCDPANGVTNPKNIPGAITQWTIAVSNTGSADASLSTITDTLAASLAHDANLVVPTSAATCDSATGTPASGANKGFKVTSSVSRNMGGSAGGAAATTSYFTTNTADGVDIAGQVITATYATVLPADGSHATAGLLKNGETVTIIFNTTVQ